MSLSPSARRSDFNLAEWRSNVQVRRELVRSLILRAVVEGEQLESMIGDLRQALGAGAMGDADRNLLNVTLHDVRTVVGGWSRLSIEERQRFSSGKMAPSSVAARVKALRNERT